MAGQRLRLTTTLVAGRRCRHLRVTNTLVAGQRRWRLRLTPAFVAGRRWRRLRLLTPTNVAGWRWRYLRLNLYHCGGTAFETYTDSCGGRALVAFEANPLPLWRDGVGGV